MSFDVMSMGSAKLSELVGGNQFPPLVTALARLVGLSVRLLDGDGRLLASSQGTSGSEGAEGALPDSGIRCFSLPVEIEDGCAATLLVGPYRFSGRRQRRGRREPDGIPTLSGTRAEVVHARAQTLVQLLADMGLRALELRREREERNRVETALRARETQYRSLVEQMNEGLLAGDRSTRITFVNSRMAAMLGYSEEELLGRPFSEFVVPEMRASYLARIQRRHVGVSEKYEADLIHKDGRRVCTLISASPLRDPQDQVIGSFAVISDITERKRSERDLRESEEKFRHLFETMQDVFYRCDPEGRLTLMSPSGARLLGYPGVEALIGRDIAEALYLNPLDRPAFLAAIEENGFARDYEVTLKKRDGTPIIVSTYSRLNRDEHGNVMGVEGAFFDITERKKAEEALRRSEERYRLIVDNVQDVIFTHLPDGTISFVSGSISHLGYLPDEITGRSIFEFVHPEDLEISRGAFLRTSRTLKGTGVEVRVRCKSGTYLWMEEHSDPVLREGRLIQVTCVLRDVTQRKSAEDALHQSEVRYSRIINNIRDIIYSYAPDGVISFVSGSIRQIGYEVQEVMGRSLYDFMHPEDHVLVQRAVDRAVREGAFDPVECRLRSRDGAYVWVEASSEPILHEGVLVQINGVARDITERRNAEEALRLSEEKYRRLVEQLSEGILVSDLDGTITFANPRMAEMLGYTVEELVGRKASTLIRDEDLAAYREHEWSRSPIAIDAHEIQLNKKDGSPGHFMVSGTPLRNREGERVGSFGVLSDITEWKRAQEELKRLSAAIEQASDSIIVADTRGVILYANPASQILTGLALSDLVGNTLDILRSNKQTDSFYRRLWDTVRRGEAWSGHVINVRSDGTRYDTNTTMSPVRDAAGRVQYVVTSSRDITREAELEAQLRHSQRMEAIGVMAGGIAHDFNNILTPVMGYTEMALNRPGLDAKVCDYLKEISAAGQRASELVQQILTFSRQTEQIKQPVQVDSIIKESLKLLRAAIPSTIIIRKRILGRGTQILADASQIHQVVMNLCTNAFHAMREKGGVLEVVLDAVTLEAPLVLLESTLPAGDYLRLRVTDSGRGMDEATQKKIFLPFFTTKQVGEGTGLGLSIVHGIVVGMGGSIHVESEVGRGNHFHRLLPVGAPGSNGSLHRRSPDPQGIGKAPDRGRRKCHRRHAAGCPDLRGVRSGDVRVPGPRPGAGCAGSRNISISLITDLVMPELTGMDLAKVIWELRADLPIILLTGYTETLDEESAREMGFAKMLRKPVPLSTIGQTVRTVLDRKSRSSRSE